MALPPLPELTLFMGLVLVLSLFGLTVSGHFPQEHRAASLRTGTGMLVLWGTIAVCCALQPFPDSFVNGRRGLLIFAGIATGLALIAGRLIA